MGKIHTARNRYGRSVLLATSGLISLLSSTAALAQAASPASAASDKSASPTSEDVAPAGEIVVTGTRITRDGYQSATPVSALGGVEIAALKPANVASLVTALPAITSGANPTTSAGSGTNGQGGINALDLRDLGAQRTLVLINGHRTVASTATGAVDINTIPQDLIQRVDVVTGGASAQYGSDAVAGVVNFVLRDKFKGLELNADYGITSRGDGGNYRFSGTAGASFLDDRLNVFVNGEYYHQNYIATNSRDWNSHGYNLINNPNYTATNGQPQFYVGPNIGLQSLAAGGLITSGPLRGTRFLAPGQTSQIAFGNGNALSGPWMIGGDWQTTMEGMQGTGALQPETTRSSVYSRASFDVSNNLSLYGEFSWNNNRNYSEYQSYPFTGLTIQADNGFLLTQYPQVAAALAAAGQNSFTLGTSSGCCNFAVRSNRDVYRFAGGLKGKFSAFGRDWTVDARYQRGIAKNHTEFLNDQNTARLTLARDAVLSNGQIVCRSTLTDPTNGCVPYNTLGTGGPSAAALAYIYGPSQPSYVATFKQDVASATVNGSLFTLPGGPISIAFGGEWRKERFDSVPNVSGGFDTTPRASGGGYNVKEGFVELDIPVLKMLDINPAVRYTDYSTSGGATTWKVSGSFTPIDGVKFRGTISRDIRAPNLGELYGSGAGLTTGTILFPSNAPITGSQTVIRNRAGNINLSPEKANTWTAGVVLQPRFAPDFSLSVDYYNINVKQLIGTLPYTQVVSLCYSGIAPQVCNGITYNGTQPPTILEAPYNFGSQKQTGIDIESTYRTQVGSLWSKEPARLTVRAQVTHYIKNVVDNLVLPIDLAGVTGTQSSGLNTLGYPGALPKWRYRVTVAYESDPIGLFLAARGFNSTVYGNNYIECTTGCPTSTVQNPTINNNRIAGAVYFDGSIDFKVRSGSHDLTLSVIATNILDKDPVLTGNMGTGIFYSGYPQTNTNLFDVLGRTFRVALKFKY